MRIELDDRERAMLGRVDLKQRPGDEVIAAERQQRGVGGQHFGRGLADRLRNFHRAAGVEEAIAVVDDRKVFKHIAFPRPGPRPGEMRRGGADGAGAEARAGATRGGQIERNAHDGDIDARQVARVAATHERESAGKGVFHDRAIVAVTGEGEIADLRHDFDGGAHGMSFARREQSDCRNASNTGSLREKIR